MASFYLIKEIPKYCIAMNKIGRSDEMPGVIKGKCIVVCNDGTMNQIGWGPIGIDEVCNSSHIPYDF